MFTQSLMFALLVQISGIDGQVRDARTHHEISSARVTVSTSRVPLDYQYTDSAGRFRFRLPDGRYTLFVESSEYDSITLEVDLVASTIGPITIELNRTLKQPALETQVIPLTDYLVPKAAKKEFENARKETRKQDCNKAIVHFQNGLRLFDQDAAAINDMGNCYRRLGMMDLAEDSFKRAAQLSNSVYIYLNLAEVYSALKRFDEAEMVLRENIQRSPNAGDGYYGLANFYFDRGRIEEAEAAALEADKRMHTVADLHLLLAKIYSRGRNSAAVRAQLEAYLKEDPNGRYSAPLRESLKRTGR